MKTGNSIDEHIAKFKLLAAAAEIDLNHALTIEVFKETLLSGLQTRMINLETPLKNPDNWYDWAMRLDHQWHKLHHAIERTKENAPKKLQKQFYLIP